MNGDFIAYAYRLRYIERWSLMRSVMKENVAEHTFHVAILTHLLCTIANEQFGKTLSVDRAVSLAIFHDMTEVITGDIPTPVKHHNPKILGSFREIEQLAAERLLSTIPDPLRRAYSGLIGKQTVPDEEAEELQRYVKAADLLDAYLKCVTELSAGNREFTVAKRQIEASIRSLQLPEADYFLQHMAPSMEKTLDELSEE